MCFLRLFFFLLRRIWVNLEESKLPESCTDSMITDQMDEAAVTGKEKTSLATFQNKQF